MIGNISILDRPQVAECWAQVTKDGGLGDGAGVAALAGVELLHVLVVSQGKVLGLRNRV